MPEEIKRHVRNFAADVPFYDIRVLFPVIAFALLLFLHKSL